VVRVRDKEIDMTERHELRWGGFAGFAFVVLAVLAALMPGLPPRVTASTDEITAYVADGQGRLMLAALFWAVGAALVIWFTAAFAEALREREERSDVHIALMAGAVLVGGAIFANAVAVAVLANGYEGRDAALTVALFQGTMVLESMIGLAAAVPLAAAGVGVMRTRMLPDWLGYVALAAAAVSALGALAIFATSGIYVPGGSFMPYISLVAGGIFVLCASGYMVREHLPEVGQIAMSPTK
jgi:hypothetical protein